MFSCSAMERDKVAKRRQQIKQIVLLGSGIACSILVVAIIAIWIKRQRSKAFFPQKNIDVNNIDVVSEKLALFQKYRDSTPITKPTIFVAISSYRDSELCLTLRDCYEKALYPERSV